MMKPLDKEKAFAAIAEELELPLVLLANPDPRVRLAMLEKIGAALASTNLTFRDLAERVVAPRPARVEPLMAAPPPMPMAALRPTSNIKIDPMKMPTNDELLRLGGYRSGPVDIEPDASAKPAATDGVMSAAELSRYGYLRKPGTPFGYSGAPGQDASTSKPDQA